MIRQKFLVIAISLSLVSYPKPVKADLFGGDVVVLTQILAQSIQTVLQLRSILQTGSDSLNLLRDINSGIRSGLDIIRIINPHIDPGVFGQLDKPEEVLRAIEAIYGAVPKGMDQDLMKSQDQSVAEVIAMNRNLYDYADQVDREKDRILTHATMASPQGAAKLQNQALGVLIGVTTQMLRTQSQMMKIMAQEMAMSNRKEKLATQNFQQNYENLSRGFDNLPKDATLPRLGGGL